MSGHKPTPIQQAQILAHSHNLRVVGKRTPDGKVRSWRVFRVVSPEHLAFVGERTTEASVLALVQRAARTA